MERIRQQRSWRALQYRSRQANRAAGGWMRWVKTAGLTVVLILTVYHVTGGDDIYRAAIGKDVTQAGSPSQSAAGFDKHDVQQMLLEKPLVNLDSKSFHLDYHGGTFRVDTSLDMSLQRFLWDKLNRSNSRYIGIVAMDPSSGKILSMIGYDKYDTRNNPCVDNRFPAASVFKIVTAAAAIETHQLEADSQFSYSGNKYTLYRSQLKDRKTRGTHKISLQDSFAQSINPVFGKIGARDLGKTVLEKYAAAFGFNQQIPFELPVPPSNLSISDEPYRWAEIASGFNRMTTLSPVHGALIAAIVLNDGKWVEPTIVERVVGQEGLTVYRGRPAVPNQVISPEASEVIQQLMRATVLSGTSQRAFRGFRRDRVLSKLVIGGKTGSINNTEQDTRFDWFVGFAQEKDGPAKLAIAVLVGHEKYIGIRSSQYARMAFQHYFKDYFSRQEKTPDTATQS